MNLDKKTRLAAYLYAYKDINKTKDREDPFICWRLRDYLVKKKKLSLSWDFREILTYFPEVLKKAPIAYKKKQKDVFYPGENIQSRLNLLDKCIKELQP